MIKEGQAEMKQYLSGEQDLLPANPAPLNALGMVLMKLTLLEIRLVAFNAPPFGLLFRDGVLMKIIPR